MSTASKVKAYYKMDESSGNPVDSTGNGYTLINTGSIPFGAGKISNCAVFDFDNSTQSFNIADDMGITNGAMSVFLWSNITTAPTSNQVQRLFLHDDGTTTYVTYGIWYKNNGGTLQLFFID